MRDPTPDAAASASGDRPTATRLRWPVRVFVAAIRLIAVVTTTWALVSRADCVFATHTCRATNLLSYFTIQSNIAFVLLTTILLFRVLRGRIDTTWVTVARVVVTTYLLISGATFAILIETAGLTEFTFLVPTSSKVLHFVVPLIALADLLLAPGRRRLPLRSTLWVLVHPLVYAVFTVVRGRVVDWYPYVFFDPAWVGSDAGVIAYAAVLGAALLTVAGMLVLSTRLPVVPHAYPRV